MTWAARLVATLLLSGASAAVVAQSNGDPVRLDDLEVGARQDKSLGVQQLSPSEARTQSSPQPRDRAVATDETAEQSTPAVAQLSPRGQATEQAQLSKAGGSPDESSAAVSSRAESRPQGVQHIGGTDRCDPQLAAAELARCQHILELRAQEFHAPAAPQLSAEETLLAEQQANQEHEASRSPETRLRLASQEDPDAELVSNQELASLYLNRPGPPPDQKPKDDEPAADVTLSQVLAALQAGGAPPTGSQ